MFKIRFQTQLWKYLSISSFKPKQNRLDKLKCHAYKIWTVIVLKVDKMKKMDMNVKTSLVTSSASPEQTYKWHICNIKLGKKYLFKTVQSPSTQSEHIFNHYLFGFGGFSLWLLSLGVAILSWLGLLCFWCLLWSCFFLSLHWGCLRFQCQSWGGSSLLRGDSCLCFSHGIGCESRESWKKNTAAKTGFFRRDVTRRPCSLCVKWRMYNRNECFCSLYSEI